MCEGKSMLYSDFKIIFFNKNKKSLKAYNTILIAERNAITVEDKH
jgi:hypothetical protein